MSSSHEFELLCGIMAQQLGLATECEVARALQQWRAGKSMPLLEILHHNGAIDEAQRAAIERAVQRQLDLHGGDMHRSLAALRPSPSLCASIAGIDDNMDSVVSWLKSIGGSEDASVDGGLESLSDVINVESLLAETGRYEIAYAHARGGLGEVMVARDKQLGRDVAVKQILPAFVADAACRQRFVREARVTGSLEHPGIVPVYGLGVQPDGRPFYAMRFIRGESLEMAVTQLHRDAAEHRLELRKLLHRFVSVCHAMHYAHSRGILHRDLKPSNIMLGPYGETLIVDWGLTRVMSDPAKQSDRMRDEQTLHPATDNESASTRWGTLVGTPAFMSPEQALGWHDSLTPASDIYSLGATLYVILTGQPPFSGSSLERLVLQVQRGEFTRPRALQANISKPLEAICLKAMATTPTDRYRSALELADDLEKYLADEPISARRDPLWRRVGRWMRRHRGTTGAIVAGFITLLIGLVFLAIALSLVSQRERSLRLTAEQEGRRADANFQLARGAIDRYLTEVTEDPLLKQHGFEPLRRRLLENARNFYEQLLSRRAADPSLAIEQAWTHFRLGSIEQEIGTSAAALDHYVKARSAFQRLAERNATGLAANEGLAMAHINLANLYYAQGQTDAARKELASARQLTATLLKDHSLPNLQRQLATCLNNEASWALAEEDRQAALTSYQQALDIRTRLYQQHADNIGNISELVSLYGNLTVFYRRFGETQKALEASEHAVAIGKKELATRTHRPYAVQAFAVAQMRLADLQAETNVFQQALASYLAADDLLSKLVQSHPNVHAFRKDLATCENNLGNLYRSMSKLDDALHRFQHAVSLCEQLVQFDSYDTQYAALLAACLVNEATLQLEIGQLDKARPLLDRALAIYRQLPDQPDKAPETNATRARIFILRGTMLAHDKQMPAARESYDQAVEILQPLTDTYPEVPFYRSYLATALERLGVLAIQAGDLPQAKSVLQRSIQLRREVAAQVDDARTSIELTTACVQLSRVLTDLGDAEQADKLLDEAIKRIQTLASKSTANVDAARRLTAALLQRGLSRMQQKKYQLALDDFEHLATMQLGQDRVGVLCQRALCLARLGRHTEAADQIDQLLTDLGKDVFALYDAAATFALCIDAVNHDSAMSAADRAASVKRYVTAAIRLLERLRDTGYFAKPENKKMLLDDPQFAPLLDTPPWSALEKSL